MKLSYLSKKLDETVEDLFVPPEDFNFKLSVLELLLESGLHEVAGILGLEGLMVFSVLLAHGPA